MTNPSASQPAAQPPPGPSVALREALLRDAVTLDRKAALIEKKEIEPFARALHGDFVNLIRSFAKQLAGYAEHPALATAPAEGVDGQDALREARDAAYSERNQCVALILRMALALGWRAGVGRHEDKPGETWEDDWLTLVSVDLPTGQASWHFHDSERGLLAGLPAYPAPWDGHDTPEKYRRVNAALAAPQPLPSAQQVGAAPVDISLGECSAWTAPAQPAGHNPEGVEARGRVEMNLNDSVWVKVTEHGAAIHAKHYADFGIEPPPLRAENGWTQFQLWKLANIFGDAMYNGGTVPIETTVRLVAPAHPAEGPPAPAAPHEGEM